MLDVAAIMDLVTSRILALDPEPWRMGGVNDAWHEALHPYGPVDEGAGTEHLAVTVVATSDRPFLEETDAAELQDERVAQLAVVFHFILDPAAQMSSLRQAARAAHQVEAALVDHTSWCSDDIAYVQVLEAFQPLIDPGGQYVEVRQAYAIRYDGSRA